MPVQRGKESTAADEALGCSRGGFSTKVHALKGALGNPLGFKMTGGQQAYLHQASALFTGQAAQALIADKSDDADQLLDILAECDITAVIPSQANRIVQRDRDWHLYKEHHLIECFFNKIKHIWLR